MFNKLDDALKEKLKNCKDEAEMGKTIAASGMELNDDLLEAVSGGDECFDYCDKSLDNQLALAS